MYNKILICCYGNGITDEKIQDLSLIMAMYGCYAVCLYGDLLFKIPSSFLCAPRAPHHANFAGQCVNINAMADTPTLGSQETRKRLGRAYDYVSEVAVFQLKRFQNYTVQSSSFSDMNRASFALQPIAVRGESRHIPFLGLFDGTKVQEQLYSTRLVEFFQTHDAALQKELQTNLDSKEKTLGKILGKFLFKPLVGEYRLARQEYREEEDSKTCYLGMGHPSSWHGWPDMVAGETPPAAGNTPIVLATTDKAEEESTESEPESESEADSRDVEQSQEGQQSTGSSPGDKTVVEVKRRGLTGVLNQLVAQTVVFSYTMGNRHPDLNPMVPGIAINAQEYKIVLFDHVNDLLLITRALPYKKFESSAMDDAGILLLWVVLNHRKFMLSFQTSRNSLDLESHFPAVAGYDMHYFKGLFSYTLDAASVKRIPKVGGPTCRIDDEDRQSLHSRQ